jgi:hypothetical protein
MIIGATEVSIVGGVIRWTAGLAVDADGAPNCYAPPGNALQPLDFLAAAGHVGDWWGIVCDAQGEPVVQGPGDPCPGYFVSTTALQNHALALTDPKRYVDASRVPYLSVPPELRHVGVKLGDVARVSYRAMWCPVVVADVGPEHHIGEGSVALARQLGLDPSPRHGGIGGGVSVTLWIGSTRGWPRTADSIATQVQGLWSPRVA